jgi:ribonuclease P protein component
LGTGWFIFDGMSRTQTLGAKERLKSRRQIEALFAGGKSLQVGPLRVFYQSVPGGGSLRFAPAVSSRNFRKAVQRNRIKRLLRECWRKENLALKQQLQSNRMEVELLVLYTGRVLPEYSLLEEKMRLLIQQLSKKLYENNPPAA